MKFNLSLHETFSHGDMTSERGEVYRENRRGPLIFSKIPHLGQEYTLLKGIPYMAGNGVSTQSHDVISTHYVIDTSGSYKRG